MILTLGALALVVVPLVVLSVMLVKEAGSANARCGSGLLLEVSSSCRTASGLPGGGWREWLERFTGQESDLEQFVIQRQTFSKFIVAELSDPRARRVHAGRRFSRYGIYPVLFFKDGRHWLASLYGLIPLEASHGFSSAWTKPFVPS